MSKSKGYIHSVESFGTVDGPGIRYVVFFQGCPMRCLYCHNPDTWNIEGGKEVTVSEILDEFNKNRTFYTNGGITASGGEPLLQLDFLTELFKSAKADGVNTCLDTSGIAYSRERDEKFCELMKYTDLVMLDIKTADQKLHLELTKQKFDNILAFAKLTERCGVPLRIRHVVVPGITDTHDRLLELGKLIGGFTNLKQLEVLPYHNLGVHKYKALGIDYPLENVEPASKQDAAKAKAVIMDGIKLSRKR